VSHSRVRAVVSVIAAAVPSLIRHPRLSIAPPLEMALDASSAHSADELKQPLSEEEKKQDTSASATAVTTVSSPSHFPLHGGSHCDIFLYVNVSNTDELLSLFNRQQLRACILASSLHCDVFPLLCALVKTTQQKRRKQLRCKDVYNELAFNLCPSTHIQTAVEKMIPQPSDRSLLLVCIDSPAVAVAAVQQRVKGELRPLELLSSQCDTAAVMKLYKVSEAELRLPTVGGGGSALSRAVANRIAIK
jgi:hypothetical protein